MEANELERLIQLIGMGDAGAVTPLMRVLRRGDAELRERVTRQLGGVGEGGAWFLRELVLAQHKTNFEGVRYYRRDATGALILLNSTGMIGPWLLESPPYLLEIEGGLLAPAIWDGARERAFCAACADRASRLLQGGYQNASQSPWETWRQTAQARINETVEGARIGLPAWPVAQAGQRAAGAAAVLLRMAGAVNNAGQEGGGQVDGASLERHEQSVMLLRWMLDSTLAIQGQYHPSAEAVRMFRERQQNGDFGFNP